MVKVIFVGPDGSETTVEGQEGDSVMETAIVGDIAGILAECGGSMMCATCHCYVDEGWADHTGARRASEDDMLESAASDLRARSQLSCQIRLTPQLDGLMVRLPEAQV